MKLLFMKLLLGIVIICAGIVLEAYIDSTPLDLTSIFVIGMISGVFVGQWIIKLFV